jgi:hypothetical protein
MPSGRQTKEVPENIRKQLEAYRVSRGLSFRALSIEMVSGAGQFKIRPAILKKAIDGVPVWDLFTSYIVGWVDRYLPATNEEEKKAEDFGAIGAPPAADRGGK